MLSAQTGLTARSSLTELYVNGLRTIRADYTGEDTRGGVVASQLAPGHMLMISLVSKQSGFASHRPLLDAISLSVTGPGGSEIYIVDRKKTISSKPTKSDAYAKQDTDSEDPFSDLKKSIRKFFKQFHSEE